MAKVLGIGGVFFRSGDPAATQEWYVKNLGLPADNEGFVVMKWRRESEEVDEATVWAPFAADSEYFGPNDPEFMVNYIVDDLDGMRAQLAAQGIEVLDKVEHVPSIGRFGWAVDCDGRRIELWEPERS